jgi:hypothetical protein
MFPKANPTERYFQRSGKEEGLRRVQPPAAAGDGSDELGWARLGCVLEEEQAENRAN